MASFVYATPYDDGHKNEIYQIDLDTGRGTVVGTLNLPQNTGAAITAHKGTIYGLTTYETIPRLLKYNLATKQQTIIGNIGLAKLEGTGEMAAHPYKNILYYFNAENLYEINPETGETKFVGNTGSDIYTTGSLAIAPDGKAYSTMIKDGRANFLCTIDLSTGLAKEIGETPGAWNDIYCTGMIFYNNFLYQVTAKRVIQKVDPNTAKIISQVPLSPYLYYCCLTISPVSLTDSKPCLLKNPSTGLVADVAGGQAVAGTTVLGWAANGGSSQKWILTPDGVIISQLGNFALDLQDIPGQQWAKDVVINPINGSLTQQWEINSNGMIKNKNKFNDLAFALALVPKDSYNVVVAYPIDEANPPLNQKWEVVNL